MSKPSGYYCNDFMPDGTCRRCWRLKPLLPFLRHRCVMYRAGQDQAAEYRTAAALFVEFLSQASYDPDIVIGVLSDPETGVCDPLPVESLRTALDDFEEWLHPGDDLSLLVPSMQRRA